MDKNDDVLIDGIDERIEAYLRGEMSAEDEVAFKKEIRQNPELRNRAMAMTSLIKGLQAQETAFKQKIKSNSELRNRDIAMISFNNGLQTQKTDKKASIIKGSTAKSKVRSILLWVTSIAAVFAIIFGIYKDHRYRMLDATVSPYYTEYDMNDISRGDVDSATVTHLYNLFSQIPKNRSMSDIIKELEPIYHSLDDDFTYNAYANDIAWSLALAYIKDDQIDKAIPILEKLKADNPNTPIFLKAQKLLKRILDL